MATSAARKRKRARLQRRRKSKLMKRYEETASSKVGFMTLPPEIRNEIYRLGLTHATVVEIRPRKRTLGYIKAEPPELAYPTRQEKYKTWREPEILRASKVIRQEASAMYYKLNDFELGLCLPEIEEAVAWIKSIIHRRGSDPFGHFSFYMRRYHWKDLGYIRSLALLFVETDLQLRPTAIPINYIPSVAWRFNLWFQMMEQDALSLFSLEDPFHRPMRRASEQAAELGQRGSKEEWHPEWFEVEFAEWMEKKLTEAAYEDSVAKGLGWARRARAKEAERQKQTS